MKDLLSTCTFAHSLILEISIIKALSLQHSTANFDPRAEKAIYECYSHVYPRMSMMQYPSYYVHESKVKLRMSVDNKDIIRMHLGYTI